MNIEEIVKLVEGEVVEGENFKDREVDHVFASDLMSDVLTIPTSNSLMLVTGLSNIQTIRTCEMADIKTILFVRGKAITEEMKELAQENDMVLIQTRYSLYRASGELYKLGILPIY